MNGAAARARARAATRRALLRDGIVTVAGLAASATLRSARAQSPSAVFPQRPVRIVVPYTPGGATDTIARALAAELQALWGQSVLVDHKPGAGGVIAATEVARAAPDGYQVLLTGEGPMTILPFLHERLPYDPLTDLTPIALVGGVPLVLVANPAQKLATLADFIALARARPGTLAYGSGGIGSSHHVSMENLQRIAGLRLIHVPYKGGSQVLQALLAGEVAVSWTAVSTALPYVQSGRLTPLALGTLARVPSLPAVPTVSESGFADFEAWNWVGIVGPRGLPAALVERFATQLNQVTAGAAYREALQAKGLDLRSAGADEFARRVRAEHAANRRLFVGAAASGGGPSSGGSSN